jgi:predicted amidophosphoribosyltransferase
MDVADEVLVRERATAQQARIEDPGRRAANLRGAFRGRPPAGPREAILIDDLVTSGATAAAAAAALAEAGWVVRGILALGVAAGAGKGAGPVDTVRGGS